MKEFTYEQRSMILAGLMRLLDDSKWKYDISLVDVQEKMTDTGLMNLIDQFVSQAHKDLTAKGVKEVY